MNQFSSSLSPAVAVEQSFIRKVYNWMALGLGLSALVSLIMLNNEALLLSYIRSPLSFILPIGELIFIWVMFPKIPRMSVQNATLAFFAYAFANGITLTPILIQYTSASLFSTFCVTGATFGVTSLYGYTTKKDLSSMGGFLFMGIIGLIIASLVNIFLQSAAIYWIVTYIGVGLSVGVTAYYTQQIKRMGQSLSHGQQANGAILGALMLYVAFVMMFVYLLRILGNRR